MLWGPAWKNNTKEMARKHDKQLMGTMSRYSAAASQERRLKQARKVLANQRKLYTSSCHGLVTRTPLNVLK